MSRMRYESLFTPTKSPGFSFAGSTSPTTGRNIVCAALRHAIEKEKKMKKREDEEKEMKYLASGGFDDDALAGASGVHVHRGAVLLVLRRQFQYLLLAQSIV